MEKRFAVKNSRGKNVFSIDAKGDGFMDGQVKPCYGGGCEGEGEGEGQSPSLDDLKSAGGKWVIQDGDGTVLAVVDPEWNVPQGVGNPADAQWPTLYLKGKLVTHKVTFQEPSVTLTPPDGSFIVKTYAGNVAAYINAVTDGDGNPPGSLVLARYFFAGQNPDPQAMKTVFLFYDNFDGWPDVTRCSTPGAYSQCPAWQSTGTWTIPDQNNPYVAGTGSISVDVPQAYPDLDINLDFQFQTGVGPAQITFRNATGGDVYLKIDPHIDPTPTSTILSLWQASTELAPPVDITTLMDPTRLIDFPGLPNQNQNARPFAASTWYELHIQAVGSGILVLFRNRDGDYTIPSGATNLADAPYIGQDSGAGYKWIRWDPGIPLPNASPQPRCTLSVQSGSAWSFDNVFVNSVSLGN